MRKAYVFIFFILFACSKDAPIPDAVVPTPSVTKFTLTVAASEGGSVDISGGTYNENSNVSTTASPAQGYVFSGWTGNASGSTNPLSISMTGNKDITATFSISQYALTVVVIGQGSVDQELVSSAKSKTDYDSGTTTSCELFKTRVMVRMKDLEPSLSYKLFKPESVNKQEWEEFLRIYNLLSLS